MNRKLNVFRNNRSSANLEELRTCKREYRELIKHKKSEYYSCNLDKLMTAAEQPNSKSFWSMIKGTSSPISTNISNDNWFDYFSNLLNTPGMNSELC